MPGNGVHPVVYARDGRLLGELVRQSAGDDQWELRLEDGRRIIISSAALARQSDGSYRAALDSDDLTAGQRIVNVEAGQQASIPVVEERAVVGKRAREKAQVVVHVVAGEREQTIHVPLIEEHVEVQRVPVNRFVDGPLAVREEGDVIIVPVMEEVLVVEKRLLLREEVRIVRRTVTTEEERTVRLRHEDVEVLRSDNTRP